ncbi:hypothetical protein C2G38_2210699 [Gigaspora rosea]|uniref:Uncharacterized protein n=1 Tax=Gigaspora rosea TaxID=44941 RepID=A0A397UEQ6_9GLOM|nr:hypothetical protein C2G38_2210699 [Gigaspora rosea]
MDKLVENRDIFKKKFSQIAEALIKQQQDAIEKYDQISYKQSAKKEIFEEEIKFIKLDISKSDEMKIKYKKNSYTGKLNLELNPIRETFQQNINKRNKILTQDIAIEQTELTIKQRNLKIQETYEESASDKYKKTLLEQECGTIDYGIEEILSQNESSFTKSHSQEGYGMEKDKTEDGHKDIYNYTETSQLNNTYIFTLWNISLDVHAYKIKDWLSYYGKTTIKRVNYLEKTKAVVIRINSLADSKLKALKTSWAIQSENGKTLRTTPGEFNENILKERREHKVSISNLPRTATESALVRQLRFIRAKAVYISSNSNSNQRKRATIYFELGENLRNAIKKTVYYYNTKLEWVPRFLEEQKEYSIEP